MPPSRKSDLRRFFHDVARRAGHRCEYCHAPESFFPHRLSVDHIVPESRGGATSLKNLALCCYACQQQKLAFQTGWDTPTEAAVNPDGNLLVATSWDRRLYVWDASTGKQQAVLHGSDRQAQQLPFSRRGDLLATTGWDGVLRLWDPMTGRELLRKEGNVQAVQFSPDDRLLAWTRRGSVIELWEVTSGGSRLHLYRGRRGRSYLHRHRPRRDHAGHPRGPDPYRNRYGR
jgi:WD40 repeat protein